MLTSPIAKVNLQRDGYCQPLLGVQNASVGVGEHYSSRVEEVEGALVILERTWVQPGTGDDCKTAG